jgi:hypothetical protein
MRKLLLLLILVVSAASANNLTEIGHIIKWVESENNPLAIGDGGMSYGDRQIQQVAIDDVNRYYGTQYTHQDAFDPACSEEIFELYTKYWAAKLEKREKRAATEEDIVRIWNGGPRGWKRDSTLKYLKKYKKYKKKHSMNKRKALVNGKLGLVTATYNHTCDVYMFKTRETLHGVSKKVVKLLPKEPEKCPDQVCLVFD